MIPVELRVLSVAISECLASVIQHVCVCVCVSDCVMMMMMMIMMVNVELLKVQRWLLSVGVSLVRTTFQALGDHLGFEN